AYFDEETRDSLRTVDDFPDLSSIKVPPGKYKTARAGNRRIASQGEFQIDSPPYPYPMPPCHGCGAPDHVYPQGPSSTSTLSSTTSDLLAPLEYLKAIPPSRRHPLDEEALMSFRRKPIWIQ
ncbi:hypothetical protein H0H92_005559, partial [Tricholoma furcatifolium]